MASTSTNVISSDEDDPSFQNLTDTIIRVKKAFGIINETEIIQESVRKVDVDIEEYKTLTASEKCKILVIENCATIPHFLEIINEENFSIFLKTSLNCFVLIAYIKNSGLIELSSFFECFDATSISPRPFLIQVNVINAKDSKIFYKLKGEIDFVCFESKDRKIKEKDFVSQICDGNFSFDLLMKALTSNVCGNFDGNILTCKIDIERKFNGLKLMEHAVENDCALCVRFLKLFTTVVDENLLEKIVKTSNVETLRAFLDFPLIDEGKELRLNDDLIQVLTSKHKNFLCIAAESGKPEVLGFLTRLELFSKTFDEALKTSNCASEKQNFHNLLVLLKNDFPFPTNFKSALELCSDFHLKQELENIFNIRKSFHEGIRMQNKQIVERFIDEFPEIQIGYGPNNQTSLRTALETAVESDNFRIYAFLLYNRFTASDDVEYQCLVNSLNSTQKAKITFACQSFYGRPFDSHIFFLYSKTRLGLDYTKSKQKLYFEKIKEFLDRLNQIPEIVPILKVIENSYTLIIVFDFDRDSVEKIDFKSTKETLGACYAKSGRIYIGAKTSEKEIIGTMIHELSHYAMQIIFENDAKPFYENDLENEKALMEIATCYEKLKNNIVIVQRVFDCYDSESFCAELIVRVPEMLAFYQDNKEQLGILKKVYKQLFDFYNEKVLKTIFEFIGNLENFKSIREIQQINDRLGNIKSIADIKLKPDRINITPKIATESKSFEVFISEIPQFTVASILEKLKSEKKNISGSMILLTSKDLENESTLNNVYSTFMITDNITLIINFENTMEIPEKALKLLDCENSPRKIILVCEEDFNLSKINTKFSQYSINHNKINYKWKDLKQELQRDILKSKVSFQSHEISLENLLNMDSNSTEFLPLPSFMKKIQHKIGSNIQISEGYDPQFFIERNFRHVKLSEDSESFDRFMTLVEGEKIVLISDEAGMGKSTILTHVALILKEKFRDNWVVRIDLHKHVDDFKGEESGSYHGSDSSDSDSSESDCETFKETFKSTNIPEDIREFISQKLAKTSSDFEQNLFIELFDKGKVILLLDGLDEISPFCQTEFTNFLLQIKGSTVKQVWITTRPNLRSVLEEKSEQVAWELEPFSKENQIDFVTKYWKNKLKLQGSPKLHLYLKTSAEVLIKHVSESVQDETLNLIGIPLQARMIADIFYDTVRKNLQQDTIKFEIPKRFDILWLYRKFMTQKIVIATKEKGVQILTEKAKNDLDGVDMVKFHEKLAVNLILVKGESDVVNNDNIKPKAKLYEINVNRDQLQRFGVVSFDFNGKPFFIHRTFAEFFVAMFIFKILSNSDMNMMKEVTKLIVLLESRSHNTIRTFIECAIKESTSVQGNEQVQRKIANCIEHRLKLKDFDFLRHFSCCSKIFLVTFLLNCLRFCGKSLAIASLQARKEESLLHVSAAKGNRALFEETWRLVEAKMAHTEIKSLFLEHDYNGLNIFLLAYHRIFTCHADFARECLRFDQLKKRKNVEMTYEFYVENSLLMRILRIAREILDEKEMEDLIPELYMLGDVYYQFNGSSPEYQLSPMTSEFAGKYLRIILTNRFEIVKDMMAIGNDIELMTTENLFTIFLRFFIEQKRANDEDGRLLEVFRWLHERFHSKDVMSFCVEKYLMKAFLKIDHVKTAEEIMKIVKIYMSEDDFCEDFLLKSENLYPVFVFSFDSFLTSILNPSSKVFTPKELQCFFLNNRNSDNYKLMNILATKHNSTRKTLNFVLNIMKDKFTAHEIFNVFESSTYNAKLLTDFFAEFSSRKKFSVYLNFIKENLSKESQKQLVSFVGVRNCLFVENSQETLEVFLSYIGNLYDKKEIIDLLKCDESIIYYSPWEQGNKKVFEAVTGFASRFLDEKTSKEIFEQSHSDENLRKCLHFIS